MMTSKNNSVLMDSELDKVAGGARIEHRDLTNNKNVDSASADAAQGISLQQGNSIFVGGMVDAKPSAWKKFFPTGIDY